jgi:hypothetical protein
MFQGILAKLGHSDDSRCSCGGKETPENLLLDCRELRKQQKSLRESLGCRASLRVLLHTKLGVERTLEFLKETRVTTRKWLQERKGRDERKEGERKKKEIVRLGRRKSRRGEGMFLSFFLISLGIDPQYPSEYIDPSLLYLYPELRGANPSRPT